MGFKKIIRNPDFEIKVKGKNVDVVYFMLSVFLTFACIYVKDDVWKVICIILFEGLFISYINKVNDERRVKKNGDLDDDRKGSVSDTRFCVGRNRNRVGKDNLLRDNTKESNKENSQVNKEK